MFVVFLSACLFRRYFEVSMQPQGPCTWHSSRSYGYPITRHTLQYMHASDELVSDIAIWKSRNLAHCAISNRCSGRLRGIGTVHPPMYQIVNFASDLLSIKSGRTVSISAGHAIP